MLAANMVKTGDIYCRTSGVLVTVFPVPLLLTRSVRRIHDILSRIFEWILFFNPLSIDTYKHFIPTVKYAYAAFHDRLNAFYSQYGETNAL